MRLEVLDSASRAASSRSRSSSRAVHSSRSRPRFASRSAWAIEAWSRFSSASLRGQVELAPVELGRAPTASSRDRPLSASSRSKRSASSAQLLLLEQDVGLALADRLVAGGDARRLLLQVVSRAPQLALSLRELLVARAPLVLALRERPLAAVEPGRAGLLLRCDLALLLRQLPLALVERGPRPLELPGRLLALPVARLQLPQPPLRGLLLLDREGLLGCQLGLEVGDACVLGLDRLALVPNPPLALLELDLELGQLRLALVEGRRPVSELLFRADASGRRPRRAFPAARVAKPRARALPGAPPAAPRTRG
jgi:hypothetical protein